MVEKKELDSKSICDIIKTCSKCNVTNFKYGDLEFSFYIDEYNKIAEKEFSSIDPLEALETEVQVTESMKKDKELEDLEELMMLDPIAYEEKMLEGELSEEDME